MNIKLKSAMENDCELLFKWANNEAVRGSAFNSTLIEYEDHRKWFEEKLKSKNSYIFIIYVNQSPIGQIRIDVNNQIGIIDYSIDPLWRGKGYGTKVLIEIVNYINQVNLPIIKLIGKVKYENKISQSVFIKSGYSQKDSESYMEYSKKIENQNI